MSKRKLNLERPGNWVPACGGTEEPFLADDGRTRLLYCWHTGTGQHAYMNLETDMVIPDDEIGAYLRTHA